MEYKLIYSDRRTLSMSIKDGELIIRAPKNVKNDVILKFIEKHSSWIKKNIEKSKKDTERFNGLTDSDILELKKQAKKYFALKTQYYSKIMNVNYGRITITSAKTRFGSCSSKGNVSFSYRLMMYPEVARDYVVVHELAHRIEMNHSKRFYKIIENVFPDYKDRKRMLK